MTKYTDTEVSAFLLNSGYPLKQIKRVLKTLGQETEPKLSAKDLRIARAANAILWLWKQLVDQSQGDTWFKHDARRAFQDSIICMQACGLIEDYDVLKVQVCIKGLCAKSGSY